METEFIFLVGAVILQCLTFGIAGYVKGKIADGTPFDWVKLGITLVYSLAVACIVISMQLVDIDTLGGFLADPGIILTPIWMQYFFIFTGIQYALNKLLDPVLSNKIVPLFASSWVSTGIPLPEGILQTAANYRRMNQERRHNMVFDQPQYLQTPILDCIDAAEALTTWRYAIQAGAWVYLIEYGVQTGAKHYWFWQGGNVCWKPISSECLEKIRKTGRFPEYSQLK